MAPVPGSIAASTEARSVSGILVEAVDLGAEAVEIFGLPAGGDHRQRPTVERALEGQHPIALGMAVDRMPPTRHLHRRLVGLGARIGEEDKVGEGRLGKTAREALALGILVEVRNVPQFRALIDEGFDEVRMGVADRGHGDAGAEIEIALPARRHEPAALAALESNIGPGVGGNDGGSRVGGVHLFNSLRGLEILASRGRRARREIKNAAPLGRPPKAPQTIAEGSSIWSIDERRRNLLRPRFVRRRASAP